VESIAKDGTSDTERADRLLDSAKVRFFHSKLISRTDDLIDELPVEKRHLSKLIIICRI